MSSASSSRKLPCSIESIPARMALFAASAPCACAAVFLRRACASSTIASSSACVNCGVSTSSVGESTPPDAHTLIMSAPYLWSSLTAYRAWSAPLITPSNGPDSCPNNPCSEAIFKIAMTSRGAQRVHCDEHARPGNDSICNGVAQAYVDVILSNQHLAQL